MAEEEKNEIDPDLKKIMQIPDDQELPDEYKVNVMLRALESHQLIIRSTAINQLVVLGKKIPDKALPKILSALRPEIDYWTVRFGAAEALGEIANKSTVSKLIEYLDDDDPDFRAKIAEQLGLMGSIAIEAGPALAKALFDKESVETRENAARALGQIGYSKAVPDLIKALKQERDDYVKRQLAWALGELGDKEAVPSLIKALKNHDEGTRANAAEALGKIKATKATKQLLEATEDESLDVQKKAIWALQQMPPEELLKEINSIAGDDVFLEIQMLDRFIFNIPSEKVSQRLLDLREPIIDEYRQKAIEINSNLESCKQSVEEIFSSVSNLTPEEAKNILENELPKIEGVIGRTSFYPFKKYKWVENALYFELEEAQRSYKEAGQMVAELREILTKISQKSPESESSEEKNEG